MIHSLSFPALLFHKIFPGAWGPRASAIANHLWQSTLFAVVAALLSFALSNNRAHIRYWLWFAASAKFFLPFSLLIVLGTHLAALHPIAKPAADTNSATYFVMQEVTEPFELAVLPSQPAPALSPIARLRAALGGSFVPPAFTAIWLAGFLIVVVRWTRRWCKIAAIVGIAPTITEGREADALDHIAHLAGLKRNVALKTLPIAIEPGIFGILRPTLLWPEGISSHLDDAQLESILAHEVCHVRRRDNLTAALHMAVEAVFWFHPLVWWLETNLIAEREAACDEDVPTLCGHLCAYAEGILKVCEFSIESPLPCISGVTGADLRQRVTAIIAAPTLARLSWPRKLLLSTAAISVTAAPIVLGQANAAHRLMLAAISAVPKPLQAAAHNMLVEAAIPGADAPESFQPATSQSALAAVDTAQAEDDMSLGPAFEVATIRPADRNDGRRFFGSRVDDSGHYTLSAGTLGALVSFAYSDNPLQTRITGGPKWVQDEFFDVNAKIDEAYMHGWDKLSYNERLARLKPMIRTLLAQRFQLKLHTEMQPTPVYALVQAKGGAKFKEVLTPDNVDNTPDAAMRWMAENPGKPRPGSIYCSTGNTCAATAVTMKGALGQIRGMARADRIVIDETGLKGYYDFSIPMTRPDDEDAMAEIADALGLKFEPRTMPVKTYVIDSAEKPSLDGAEVAPAAQQNSTNLPHFETVSIRPVDPSRRGNDMFVADGYQGEDVTPAALVLHAYNLQLRYQVIGLPAWASSTHYEVIAKLGEADVPAMKKLKYAQMNKMLQPILEERFTLRCHWEKRTLPTYTLELSGKTRKLREPQPEDKAKPVTIGGATLTRDAILTTPDGLIVARDVPMSMLVSELERESERHVVDATGLSGKYDFEVQMPQSSEASSLADSDNNSFDQNSTTERLQDGLSQIGLRLVPSQTEVPVLVIDQLNQPSPN